MQKRPSSMPINIERPQSALLRGIRITEFKDHVINPDPIVLQETDFLLEEFLSPTKLKALTGVDDLYSVDNLEMVVDTSETSLGNFGIYLPNLKQLKLNSSFVPRIRDLGTSLGHLKVLWLARSGLSDLDGIPALNNLQELYLAYNEIQDLSPCSMLENLKVLDLEGNLVEDIRQVEFLSLCSNLASLTLEGNPICIKPNQETQPNSKYNYRREVLKMLPNLKSLDDEPVVKKTDKSKDEPKKDVAESTFNQQCPFDDDWQLINKCLEEGVGPAEEKLAINDCRRPGTATSSHGNSPVPNLRPLSAMRPLSSCRPGSALQRRPMSGNRPGTSNLAARPYSDPVNEILNDASDLTIGPSLYGNPLRGLMARRKNRPETEGRPPLPTETTKRKEKEQVPNVKKDAASSNKADNDTELYKELKSWRKEHEKKMEERKKYFEPQVLRIDDYAEPVLSDNDDDEIEDDNEYEVEDELNNKYKVTEKSRYEDDDDDERYGKKHNNTTKKLEDRLTNNKKSHQQDEQLYNMNRVSSATSINTDMSESASSSRVPTGDTGYASISEVSLTNLSSKGNLKTQIQSSNIRQPVIVSSSASALQPGSPSAPSLTSKTGLKQLKGNLSTPLSGYKLNSKN